MDINKDYYKILGVEESSTFAEIKTAYRKLAMRYHPDRNPSNKEYEDILKEINEAYETLGNSATRFVYDEYRKENKREKEKTQVESEEASHKSTNYKRKRKITKKEVIERRVYIKGELFVKFYGERVDELSNNSFREEHYKIFATDAEITILQQNIFPLDGPEVYKKVYGELDIFKTPLKQPIKCRVIEKDETEYFELNIQGIRIVNPEISDVAKSEGETLGTLNGEVYGFIQDFETIENETWVDECFGPTGNTEEKIQDGVTYKREEYYHVDCSKFWGDWVKQNNYEDKTRNYNRQKEASTPISIFGCSSLVLPFIVFMILLAFRQSLLVPLLLIGIVFLILYFRKPVVMVFSAAFRGLWWLLLSLFLIFGIRSCFTGSSILPVKSNTQKGHITTTRIPEKTQGENDHGITDSLISHHIDWYDFNNRHYSANLTILNRDLNSSIMLHSRMDLSLRGEKDFSKVYSFLFQLDKNSLNRVYREFDSIRISQNLDDTAFANMVVSCVQNFPYTLVLDNSCDLDYNDSYVSQYLASCTGDCCVGYEKYGVRSPVEFLSDLRGDCDTRALLLFAILKHFDYNIALLTSSRYKHALIAINFNEMDSYGGIEKVINNRPYLLWETTSTGFRPGMIPYEFSNLNFWNISLLSNPQ